MLPEQLEEREFLVLKLGNVPAQGNHASSELLDSSQCGGGLQFFDGIDLVIVDSIPHCEMRKEAK